MLRLSRFIVHRAVLVLAAVALAAPAHAAPERAGAPHGAPVVVRTTFGPVEGEQLESVRVFRGIPYAAAPVGKLRFQPPVDPQPWTDVRPAHAFGAPCAQPGSPTEDCLFVNVWAPTEGSQRKPVMVWIHGGAMTTGSAAIPIYDGAQLAAHGDVVVVSLQYRLGLFGFLALDQLGGKAFAGSANVGILDQIAALRWVRANIAAFGGDPDNVTIFGQSGGGTSVYALLGTPLAQGLFHKAIIQSGAPVEFITGEAARKFAQVVLQLAKVTSVSDLQALPADRLLEVEKEAYHGQSAYLSYDGVVFSEPPIESIRKGKANVPLMIGTTLDELGRGGPIAGVAIAPRASFYDPLIGMSESELRERLQITLSARATAHIVDSYKKRYPTLAEAVARMRGDIIYRLPSIRIAEVSSQRQPTYMYLFAVRTHAKAADGTETDVALHMAELPFVFGLPQLIYTGSKEQQAKLIAEVQAAWTNFARTGDPNVEGHPVWPKYDTRRRATMQFDITGGAVVNDPYSADRKAWSSVSFRDLTSIDAQEWFLHDLASVRRDYERRH